MARKGRRSQISLVGDSTRAPLTPARQPRSRLSIGSYGDRYIIERNPDANLLNFTPTKPMTIKQAASPNHVARLAYATSTVPNSQILTMDQSVNLSSVVASNPLATPLPPHPLQTRYYTPNGEQTRKKCKVLHVRPERVLDAPEMRSDEEGCTQLITWSADGLIVGLDRKAYLWNPITSGVSVAATLPTLNTYITALEWSSRFSKLALLDSAGAAALMDPVKDVPVWRSTSHWQGTAEVMCSADTTLAIGGEDGMLLLFDPRVRQPARKAQAHRSGFSELRIRGDARAIVSAGYDKTLKVWDARQIGSSDAKPLWFERGLLVPVKALAWCPWYPSVLAVGGGLNHASLYCWNVDTNELASKIENLTSSIETIQFSVLAKQILITHGLPGNFIRSYRYPVMTEVASTRLQSHHGSITYAAVSPRGDVVATGSEAQCIKLWRFWETPRKITYHPSERNTIQGTEMLR